MLQEAGKPGLVAKYIYKGHESPKASPKLCQTPRCLPGTMLPCRVRSITEGCREESHRIINANMLLEIFIYHVVYFERELFLEFM